MSMSIVFSEMEVVSSTTSRLCACQYLKYKSRVSLESDLLNDDLAFILESLKVGFQSQVVVEGLDVLGQNLTTFGNVEVGTHGISIAATHPSVRAVASLDTRSRESGV